MSNRQRGDYFERQTREALRSAGWVVVRSAGSLGPADLVAVRRNSMGGSHVLLISCKVDGRCSGAERAALLQVSDQAAAEGILAHRPRRGAIVLSSMADKSQRAELKVPTRPKHRKGDDDTAEAEEAADDAPA